MRVHPTLIKKEEMIAKVEGVMNAVSVVGDKVGETLYYGAGAGGDATASAVISDIVSIVRGSNNPMLGFKKSLENGEFKLKNREDIVSKYYLRISVEDKIGILEKISGILAQNNISIDTFLQQGLKQNGVNLLLSTHESIEKNILKAITKIEELDFVNSKVNFIRII